MEEMTTTKPIEQKGPNKLATITGQEVAAEEKKKKERNINELDHDSFMKLFLEQLKNQDPTAPMETDKIITQTAQLTQVEMMEQSKKTMLEVAEAMKSTKNVNEELKKFQESFKTSLENLNHEMGESAKASYSMSEMSALNTVAMIGKIAETNLFSAELNQEGMMSFSLYFDEAIDSKKGQPSVNIFDQQNHLVAKINLQDKDGQKGYIDFVWDGKQEDGKDAPQGSYIIKAEYNLDEQNNQYHEARIGRGEVQSVIFKEGKPFLRMGELIVPISSALEFYEKDR